MAGHSMGRLEWALFLALSVFWGASFFFYKVLVTTFGPFTIVLGRMGIAALVLNLILAARGERLPPPKEWGAYFLMALLSNVIPFSLFAFGEQTISSSLASIINAMTPIFTVIVAHFWTHNEKLAWNKALGVGFGFAGVAILMGPSALHGDNNLIGELACLGSTISYGFGGVYGKRFAGRPLLTVVTAQMTAATLLVAPLSLAIEHPWTLSMPGLPAWAALGGIALISTVLAYLIFFHILAKAGATYISLVTFLIPVSGLFLGAVLLNERIGASDICGMAVISLGLAAIDGRPLSWLKQRAGLRSLG
ncbi:drug/metabolite transporter (DMT)-like permease [Rhizomicrobium palustre]|uniref:Drug/metabolite transporter (DMT)-like permease n=1 Tax=Rhizomicrobium palustre TaxID=189966 RepID=A0A846MVG8_9PROT|nr:EamA family transporter [Rhizomicrobium palustre]NIK87474.1 drug/metabolite transporter (DMT)-like permease [Rhizomicrobium palustre]